ncbi:MAG TPA: PatB family C-S lyase [Bacteroidales bacterium]|nr:PatB family C-S lyase [Bacteroidales bacterium]
MHYNFDEIVNREQTDCVKYDLRKVVFRNDSVIPMWVADMDFRTPDFVIGAIQKRLEHEILGYSITPHSYFDSIVQWNLRHHQWKIQPGWISFSPGVVPALSLLIMTYTNPGDGIIIQPPVYFPFFSVIRNQNRLLVENPLRLENGRYEMDFDDLESKIGKNTRMMFLCSPHNPGGMVWPAETLKKVAEICIRHNVLLISDEIHSDLVYPAYKHIPTAGLSGEIAANTITCMSPSKTFNLAGLSSAYLVISNPELRERYEKMLDLVHVGAGNIFGYVATEAAYNYGDDWLRQLMQYLQGNLDFLSAYIKRHIPLIKVMVPEATYLVWLDCKGLGMGPEKLKSFMIHEAGLGFNDGPQFGREGEGFQRINIGCPRVILEQALQKLSCAIDKYLKK